MKVICLYAVCAVLMVSCSTGAKKKVLVMGKGTLTEQDHKINLKQGSGYAEIEVEIGDAKQTELDVTVDGEKRNISIPEGEGFYILNLRTDTVVGAKQNLGTDLNTTRVISQEDLKLKIDSLVLLTTGTNVKEGGTNYLVGPGQAVKISSNKNARVYGPFTKIPAALDPDPDGKEFELFKFYTNTEMRELIEKLREKTF